MGRKKKTVQYTVKDHPGLLIEVESPQDNEISRQRALDEVRRRIDEEDELGEDSFPDGLGIDDLILVDYPKFSSVNRELQPLEIAAKKIAQLAQARRELQKNQENFQEYLPLIDALFKPERLTSEEQEKIQNKSFSKALEDLASAKVEYDALEPDAKEAWELLKPIAIVPVTKDLAKINSDKNGEGKESKKAAIA